MNRPLQRAAILVAVLNLAWFSVEIVVARAIGSVSLFADSMDFLEDASVNFLIAVAIAWSVRARARVGSVLAVILLLPGCATLVTAWEKFSAPGVPEPIPLTLTGLGALVINSCCALLLARFRSQGGSLTRAAWLSARNDMLANVAIIAAGLITAATHSAIPDLIVGLAIAAMNADAAREVWTAARSESVDSVRARVP